jgi:transcriptional regulator with XRE-family HTH domain
VRFPFSTDHFRENHRIIGNPPRTCTVNSLIIDERTRRSMTQKRLAHEAGIDPRTLRKIEKGEQVSPESLLSVYRVLGISPEPGAPQAFDAEEVRYGDPFEGIGILGFLIRAALILVVSIIVAMCIVQVLPNGKITIESQALCSEGTSRKIVEEAQGVLPGISLAYDQAVSSTDGCKVDASLRVANAGPSDDEIVSALKSHGIKATVVRKRRPFY